MSENNKALQAELKTELASNNTTTVSDVAAKMQQKKTLKTRNVKDFFFKNKSEKAINNANRVIEKQHRSYILRPTDEKHADVYYTTTYRDATQKELQLDFATMRVLAQQYLSKLKKLVKFTVKDVYTHYDIFGSSRSDYPRNALFELSKEFTMKEVTEKFDECVAQALTLKKQAIYYNAQPDSRRKVYLFVKI